MGEPATNTPEASDINAASAENKHLRTWKDVLGPEKEKPYFKDLMAFVERERATGKIIYPKNSEIFSSMQLTPFDEVKVVIIGQDPYHGPNQAHGLSFSVKPGVPFPPSLNNIFLELKSDLGIPAPSDGCLERWARQGVLLLNAVLTVEGGKPQSHSNVGWEQFTDTVIRTLAEERSGLVFLLWGAFAQKKAALIDRSRHFLLSSPHPSPLSASRGFFGCRHFSQANEILARQGETPIEW